MNRDQAITVALDYLYPCRSLDPRLNGKSKAICKYASKNIRTVFFIQRSMDRFIITSWE